MIKQITCRIYIILCIACISGMPYTVDGAQARPPQPQSVSKILGDALGSGVSHMVQTCGKWCSAFWKADFWPQKVCVIVATAFVAENLYLLVDNWIKNQKQNRELKKCAQNIKSIINDPQNENQKTYQLNKAKEKLDGIMTYEHVFGPSEKLQQNKEYAQNVMQAIDSLNTSNANSYYIVWKSSSQSSPTPQTTIIENCNNLLGVPNQG